MLAKALKLVKNTVTGYPNSLFEYFSEPQA
jgi:hypothetical protein